MEIGQAQLAYRRAKEDAVARSLARKVLRADAQVSVWRYFQARLEKYAVRFHDPFRGDLRVCKHNVLALDRRRSANTLWFTHKCCRTAKPSHLPP